MAIFGEIDSVPLVAKMHKFFCVAECTSRHSQKNHIVNLICYPSSKRRDISSFTSALVTPALIIRVHNTSFIECILLLVSQSFHQSVVIHFMAQATSEKTNKVIRCCVNMRPRIYRHCQLITLTNSVIYQEGRPIFVMWSVELRLGVCNLNVVVY